MVVIILALALLVNAGNAPDAINCLNVKNIIAAVKPPKPSEVEIVVANSNILSMLYPS